MMELSHRTTWYYTDRSALALLQLSFVNQVILENHCTLAQLTLNVQCSNLSIDDFDFPGGVHIERSVETNETLMQSIPTVTKNTTNRTSAAGKIKFERYLIKY